MKNYNKVLCTGGSGLVGKYLQEIMPSAKYISTKDADLTNYHSTWELFCIEKPTIVIHLAAMVGGIIDNINYPVKYLENNLLMNTNIIKASHAWDVKNFIGILSSCIYPDVVESYPMTEEQMFLGPPPETNFSYAFAKRAMAVQIDAYNKQYNKDWSWLAPCNLYGKYDKYGKTNSHFVAALIRKIYEAEKSITLFGTGKPLRQFMLASDLAKVIKTVVDKNIHGYYNVAPKEVYSIDEIAKIAIEACGKPKLKIKYNKNKPDGQYRKDISSDKLDKAFGKNKLKFISLSDGIANIYNEYKKE